MLPVNGAIDRENPWVNHTIYSIKSSTPPLLRLVGLVNLAEKIVENFEELPTTCFFYEWLMLDWEREWDEFAVGTNSLLPFTL